MIVSRRALLLAPLFAMPLAGCGDDAPPASYPPPTYDYLPGIKLDVGRVEIDDSWAPRGSARRVEHLAPIQPREALRRMAEDRLGAGGNSGRAAFIIEDASITRGPREYQASLAVRVELVDEAGSRLGEARARVVQVRPIRGESERAVRDELYAFVRDLMSEMNVEFEFQVRRTMKEALQVTVPAAPDAGPVDAQPLETPGPDRSPPPAPLGTLPVPRVPTPLR
jgi:hypothetical protein